MKLHVKVIPTPVLFTSITQPALVWARRVCLQSEEDREVLAVDVCDYWVWVLLGFGWYSSLPSQGGCFVRVVRQQSYDLVLVEPVVLFSPTPGQALELQSPI